MVVMVLIQSGCGGITCYSCGNVVKLKTIGMTMVYMCVITGVAVLSMVMRHTGLLLQCGMRGRNTIVVVV